MLKVCFVSWAGKDTKVFEGELILGAFFGSRGRCRVDINENYCVVRADGFDYEIRSTCIFTDIDEVKRRVEEYLNEATKTIVIIGSHGLIQKINAYRSELKERGNTVFIPAFDDHPKFNELELCEFNRNLIEIADEVHVIWDGRSVGTVFDFGMAFALKKPVKIVFIEPKSITGLMRLYSKSTIKTEGEILHGVKSLSREG